MTDNGLYLNQMIDFINTNAATFGFDSTALNVSKIPFGNQPTDPSTMTVTEPTFVGYKDDIWLVVPKAGGGSDVYNMTSILKAGAIRKINNITSNSADGNLSLKSLGDIAIKNDQSTNSITIDSSAIDAKISNTTGSIGSLTADVNKNKSDIAANKNASASNTNAISSNTSGVAGNKANIATNTSAITKNAQDISLNTSAIARTDSKVTTLATTAVQTVTSSDNTVSVTKTGTVLDLKVSGGAVGTVTKVLGVTPDADGNVDFLDSNTIQKGTSSTANKFTLDAKVSTKVGNIIQVLSGQSPSTDDGLFAVAGSGSGTVTSVGSVSPDTNGNIAIVETNSIKQATGTTPNSIGLDLKLSSDAGNQASMRNGLYVSGSGGGGTSGLDTINNITALNKNIDIADPNGGITFVKNATTAGKIDASIKVDPAVGNLFSVSKDGVKVTAPASGGGKLDTINSIDAVNKNINIKALDTSVVIAPDASIAGDITVKTNIDPRLDNLIGDKGKGIFVAGTDFPVGNMKDTVFFDDTYAGTGTEDGSLTNPYSDLGNAVNATLTKSKTTGRLFTLRPRDSASITVGKASETILIGDNTQAQYAWIHIIFPNRVIAPSFQVDFQAKTDQNRNTVYIKCGSFTGYLGLINPQPLTGSGAQEDGINIYLECDAKVAHTDRPQFELDIASVTGKPQKKFVHYVEDIGTLIELENAGNIIPNIIFTQNSSSTDFEFLVNTHIKHVDTTQATTIGNPKADYIEADNVANDTKITTVSIRAPNDGHAYIFNTGNVDNKSVITDSTVIVDNVVAKKALDLPNTSSPTNLGSLSYDEIKDSLAFRGKSGIIRLGASASDSASNTLKRSIRFNIEGLVETFYGTSCIFFPRSYVSFFDQALEVKAQAEFDHHCIGIRRKPVGINNSFPISETMDTHNFSTMPSFEGVAFFKYSNITSILVTDARGTTRDLQDITFNIDNGESDDEIRENIKEGFTYTLRNPTTGQSFSFMVKTVVGVLYRSVHVIGFTNIGTYTNITDVKHKPYASVAEITADQANISEFYIGDYIDFPLNKSLMKDKTREMCFPNYYPLYITDEEDIHRKVMLLVGYCPRINDNPVHTIVGQKALTNDKVPPALISFIQNKWTSAPSSMKYQVIGFPIKAGIVDSPRGSNDNFCRSFIPFKARFAGDTYSIQYYWGNNVADEIEKFNPKNLYGDKCKWASQGEGELTDSAYFISSIMQDCPYLDTIKYGFELPKATNSASRFISAVSGVEISYITDEEDLGEQHSEAYLALSDSLADYPTGTVFKKGTPNEDVYINPRELLGNVMSPSAVLIKEKGIYENASPPVPISSTISSLEDSSNKQSVRYV